MLHLDPSIPSQNDISPIDLPANDNALSPVPMRVVNLSSLLGVISVTILIGTQLFILAAAGTWALGGLLHLAFPSILVLAALFGIVALWGSVIIAQLAYEAETAPDNN